MVPPLLLMLCVFLMNTTPSSTLGLDGQLFEKAEARDRRDVIEEEKYYNIQTVAEVQKLSPWMKGLTDNPTTKASLTNEDNKKTMPLFQTTEIVTDKPTSRGARASNENWIKLPYTSRDEDERDNVLTPPNPSGELLNNRMPRVDFVTQNKVLDTQESRTDKDTIQRTNRNDDISRRSDDPNRRSDEISRRSEFVRPDEEDRGKNLKPIYPRQANYYPDEPRRTPYYSDKYYPMNDYYRTVPPYDDYERRRYYGASPSSRYNEAYTDKAARKPKRVIYYAHLPEVVRAPPSVDLRYRYSMDPYGPRRPYDGDYNPRASRYDYRYWNRPPYAPLRRDRYRDLAGAASVTKDTKLEEKITVAPVLPQKDGKAKNLPNVVKPDKSMVNNRFVDTVNMNFDDEMMKGFQDVIVRPEDGYLRYDEPYFKSVVDDPYSYN